MTLPFAVLFDLRHYTPGEAHSFLQSCAEIGLVDTEFGDELRDDYVHMKSVQRVYDGPFTETTHPECPGLVLRFEK